MSSELPPLELWDFRWVWGFVGLSYELLRLMRWWNFKHFTGSTIFRGKNHRILKYSWRFFWLSLWTFGIISELICRFWNYDFLVLLRVFHNCALRYSLHITSVIYITNLYILYILEYLSVRKKFQRVQLSKIYTNN